MTPDTLTAWLGLSESELAELLEAGSDESGSWCKHEIDAGPDARMTLAPLEGLVERLRVAFSSPEEARAWMREPNRHLGEQRPIDALQSGGVVLVFNALAFVGAIR